MTATRVFSTAAYWVAGIVAILLSLSPKFGALLHTIPVGVIGGVTLALYGIIGLIGVRMWIDNRVDFGVQKNLYSVRSEEHTSELQSLMRISYAVFCLKKKTKTNYRHKKSKPTVSIRH